MKFICPIAIAGVSLTLLMSSVAASESMTSEPSTACSLITSAAVSQIVGLPVEINTHVANLLPPGSSSSALCVFEDASHSNAHAQISVGLTTSALLRSQGTASVPAGASPAFRKAYRDASPAELYNALVHQDSPICSGRSNLGHVHIRCAYVRPSFWMLGDNVLISVNVLKADPLPQLSEQDELDVGLRIAQRLWP